MKYSLKFSFSVLAILSALSAAHSVFAAERFQPAQYRDGGNFLLGVCVGETLAGQGISLPLQSAAESNKEAVDSAIQMCRSQNQGEANSPTTSPAPSPAPSPVTSPISIN
jgi:hypothetical protein